MGTEHTVGDNEVLLGIAQKYDFRTTDPILAANPGLRDLAGGNYDVLRPGTKLAIPDATAVSLSAATSATHVYTVKKQQKDLIITLQMPDGTPIPNVASIKLIANQKEFPGQDEGKGTWRWPDYPVQAGEAELHVSLYYNTHQQGAPALKFGARAGRRMYKEPAITLHVGGMDPLTAGTAEERGRAVQKLLSNLGYYSEPIDGDLKSERARAALRKFQSLHHLKIVDGLDNATQHRLIDEVQNPLKSAAVPPLASDPESCNFALKLGTEAGSTPETVTLWSEYLEPTSPDQTTRTELGKNQRFFPAVVYVAPSDAGSTSNLNVIRMKPRRFIFLDSGRWLNKARDFSVIWGRHVYLCQFAPGGAAGLPLNGARKGLDTDFFTGMKQMVKVVTRATAHWAPEGEFDWDHLLVVIPDLHLMTAANGAIWRDEFILDPELDLLYFAEQLKTVTALRNKLKVIQIGDAYDLWVGREPRLWKENEQVKMELIAPPDQCWSCGKPGCEGHPQRGKGSCPGHWLCGRVRPARCTGHDMEGSSCPTTVFRRDNEMPTFWSCGRAWPPCPEDHTGPEQICRDERENPGMLWKCRKLVPPCPGHFKPGQSCPETVDAVGWIRSWIRQIQGYEGAWVEPLLRKRQSLPALPMLWKRQPLPNGESLASLDAKLTHDNIWLNPAEAAFRLIALFADLRFLYGNHDSYMIDRGITAGLPARERIIEIGGVFVEHGHRLEATLQFLPVPKNQDGAVTGYKATMSVYRNRGRLMRMAERGIKPVAVADDFFDWVGEVVGPHFADGSVKPGFEGVVFLDNAADSGAKGAEQPQYRGEYAQVWLGRNSRKEPDKMPPHVFVIGHTHCPMMSYIDIVFDVV